jgi:histidyl-tRNA synthetase
MSKSKTIARLPRGFQDRGGADIAATNALIEKISEVYKLYGFEPLETPFFEYTDTLGKFLPDTDRPNAGVFSVQDDDEQWMSLRYDLTAPLARFVAQNFDSLPKPYRSSRHGYVFRNEKPGPGRFRQFMQCDADIVGASSVAADAEICMMAADCMEAAGIKRGDYVIRVNNRKVLDGVMEAIGLGGDENSERRLIVLRAIDKYDRLGIEGVEALLGEGRKDESGDFTLGAGLNIDQIINVVFFFRTPPTNVQGEEQIEEWEQKDSLFMEASFSDGIEILRIDNVATIERLRDRFPHNIKYQTGLDELEKIADLTRASRYGTRRILIDPSVVRGLEYYTGPVFEAELTFEIKDDKGQPIRFGSVGGGGRYDGLIARFRDDPVPATGFSVGISRLQAALTELNKTTQKPNELVIVTVMDKDNAEASAKYQTFVSELRQAKIPAEMYLGDAGFNAQLKYADKRKAIVAVIQGSNERENNQIIVKDLIAGAELAKTAKTLERDAYLALKEKSQLIVSENELVQTVRDVIARYIQ